MRDMPTAVKFSDVTSKWCTKSISLVSFASTARMLIDSDVLSNKFATCMFSDCVIKYMTFFYDGLLSFIVTGIAVKFAKFKVKCLLI